MSDVLTKNYDPDDEMWMLNLVDRVCDLERKYHMAIPFDPNLETRIRALERKLNCKPIGRWDERISRLESKK